MNKQKHDRPLFMMVLCALVLIPALASAPPSNSDRKPRTREKPSGSSIQINRPLPEIPGTSTTLESKKLRSASIANDSKAKTEKNVQPKAELDKSEEPQSTDLVPESSQVIKSFQTVGLFAMVSLAPAAILMLTAFVRINIVLLLLRQALGSPQIPGNQVLTALALMLTALVMRPVGETVYREAIVPYANNKIAWDEAYQRASKPIKAFMIDQIEQSKHTDYLWDLYDETTPETSSQARPVNGDDFPMQVVAPAYLLSEITTGLIIGFYLYLPFLVIDLVVSAVLAAMGLFMLPPSLVALPVKLILFVMIDGWVLVAIKLLQSFGPPSG